MKRKRPKDESSFIDIDENELDKEWIEQPKLYMRWATRLADAKLVVDEAKANWDLVIADLDASIRSKPQRYKLEKATEPAIKQAIMIQIEYTNAQQAFHSAKHRVGILEAGVQALEHRKRALEKLVDLYMANYFGTPRARDAAGDYVRDVEQKSARRKYRRNRDD